MEKVIIYGNGPVAQSAYLTLKTDSPYEVAAFTVESAFLTSRTLLDLPLVPFEEVQSSYPSRDYLMMIAVGYVRGNRVRAEKYRQAVEMGYRMVSHISSKALVGLNVEIGENSMIGPNTIIDSSARIGANVRIAAGCYIGHDTVIGDHCFISNCAVVGGSVRVGEYSFIGLNATIRNKINIAAYCYIGAGAVLLQDTKERQVFLARPAELLPISSDDLPIM